MKRRAKLLGTVAVLLLAASGLAVAQVVEPEGGGNPASSQSQVGPAVATPQVAPSASPDPSSTVEPTTPASSDWQPPMSDQGNANPYPNQSVEDGAVETPYETRVEWVPPEDAGSLATPRAATRSPNRPRKVLSDAGDTSGWSTPYGQTSGADALSERAPRRERPVDPMKRSDLVGLARTLGALHALRVSCGGRDDQTWRSRMATLLDMEAPSGGQLRDPLVDAFNGGFSTQGRGASPCPAEARAVEAGLAKEGRRLSLLMAARYRAPAAPAVAPAAQNEADRSDRPALPTNPSSPTQASQP